MELVRPTDVCEDDFGEEEADRHESEIDRMIQEFVDEPSIQHDNYPSSDEEDEEGHKIPKKPKETTHFRRGEGRLYKDQTFFNGVAFKEAVLDYALRTSRNLKQYRYDKDKIEQAEI